MTCWDAQANASGYVKVVRDRNEAVDVNPVVGMSQHGYGYAEHCRAYGDERN